MKNTHTHTTTAGISRAHLSRGRENGGASGYITIGLFSLHLIPGMYIIAPRVRAPSMTVCCHTPGDDILASTTLNHPVNDAVYSRKKEDLIMRVNVTTTTTTTTTTI